MKPIEEIIEDFSYAEEWEDKYTYLIELGNTYVPLSEEERNEENRVPGCISKVWVVIEKQEDKFYFRASSDAAIVNGLAYIICSIFSGKTAQEIKSINPDDYFTRMDIMEHISPNRRNGLTSMADVIKTKVS